MFNLIQIRVKIKHKDKYIYLEDAYKKINQNIKKRGGEKP
jgi:hypothetical protein